MNKLLDGEHWKTIYQNHHRQFVVAQYIGVFVVGLLVAWFVFAPAAQTKPVGGNEVADGPQIWTCAMHPQIRRDKPGNCPICGMKLVPVTKSSGGMRTLTISPEARALMNIETAPVERKYVEHEIRMVGKVDYDETKLGYITAWVPGRLDRLFVDFTGIEVKKGYHMVSIYSERLYSAQEELIQSLKYARPPDNSPTSTPGIDLVESSREKLRLLGLTDEQIKEIELRKKPDDHVTIYSPVSGIVIHKLKQEGERVQVGDRIYTIADLSEVWVHLDAYESDLPWLKFGQDVTLTTESFPGEPFKGRINFVQPVLNDKTRTVKARVNVLNPDGKLKPEMFVHAVVRAKVAAGGRVLDASLAGKWISPMHPEIVKDEPGTCDVCGMPLVRAETLGFVTPATDEQSKPLVIPASAALVTGTRAIVYVENPTAKDPTFDGREIVLGRRAGDYYIVLNGLKEGELVVTRGNFKIDSEIQIQAKPSMMTPDGGGGGGGHDHGGGSKKPKNGETTQHVMTLPADFQKQIEALDKAYDQVTQAVKLADLEEIRVAFEQLSKALNKVDGKLLDGHPKMLWGEFGMLLGNDVVEGRKVDQMKDVDRIYLSLKNNIRRMRMKLGIMHEEHVPTRIEVTVEFQQQIGKLWSAYLPIGQALVDNKVELAQQSLVSLHEAFSAIDESSLAEDAMRVWKKEQANLAKVLGDMQAAKDLAALRASFSLLSDEIGVLIKSFGTGDVGPMYQLHCPMVFEGRGAIWFQPNDQPRNPYYGVDSPMLKCIDRVEMVIRDEASKEADKGAHKEHQHHE